MPKTFGDGTAATIGLAEHYFMTAKRHNNLTYTDICRPANETDELIGTRTPSFADPGNRDVVPITEGSPPRSRASVPGVTFQNAPRYEESDGRRLQSTQPTGLKVAMMDGSVRTIAPGVAEHVFWAAVTPNAGDGPPLD